MSLDPLSAILDFGTSIIDRLWPDPTQAAEAKAKLLELKIQADADIAKGQLEVNAAEAANTNLFVAGWRPFVGWVCASAFAWFFVLQPLLTFLLVVSGKTIPPMPSFDMSTLTTVLFGMLGLGTLRTIEKTDTVGKIATAIGAKKK